MDNNSKYISNKTLLVIIGICIFLAFISVTPLVFADGDSDDAIHSDITSTESSDSVDEDISDDTNIDSEVITEADTETDTDSNELDVDADSSQLEVENKTVCTVSYDKSKNPDKYTSFQDAIENINKGERINGQSIPDNADIVLKIKVPIELNSSTTIKKPMRITGTKDVVITKSNNLKDSLFVIDCANKDKNIVQFKNMVIKGNGDSDNKGSLIEVRPGSQLTLQEGCALKDNNADKGGAILACNGSKVVMQKGSFIENCSAESGGAIYADESSEIKCTSCTLKSNSASDNGGAIYLSKSSLELISAQLLDNKLSDDRNLLVKGSVIYGKNCRVNAKGDIDDPCKISNSELGSEDCCKYASAIYLLNTDSAVFNNCEFSNFKAKNGAVLQVNADSDFNSKVELNNCNISYCEAEYGGAIFLGEEEGAQSSKKNIEVSLKGKTNISNCKAKSGGAVVVRNNAIFNMGDESSITNCTAWSNSNDKEGLGGAIDVRYGQVELSGDAFISNCHCTCNGKITDNEAMGGAVNLSRQDPISDAESPYARLIIKDKFKITDCIAVYGGAISQQDNSSVKLIGPVEISGCKAECNGGVVSGVGGSFSMDSDNLGSPKLFDNRAEGKGGAIYSGGTAGEEYRVTLNAGAITSNTAGVNGGGVCIYGHGSPEPKQNVVNLGHSIRITDNKVEDRGNNLEVMKRGDYDSRLVIVEPNEGDSLKVGITGYKNNGTDFCSNVVGGQFAVNGFTDEIESDKPINIYNKNWENYIFSDVSQYLRPYMNSEFGYYTWCWGIPSEIVIKNQVEGDFANPDDLFGYTIFDYGDMLIKNKDELGDSIQFNDNKISFELKNGEEIKLSVFNYQAGPKFTVTQTKRDGYTSTNKLDNLISQDSLVCNVNNTDGKCENHTLVFNNKYKNIPITAVDIGSDAVFDVFKGIVGILIGFGLSSAAIRLRRYRKTM